MMCEVYGRGRGMGVAEPRKARDGGIAAAEEALVVFVSSA